jgi:hypothetical protein
MQDKSGDDACRNGKDSTPAPIRENAKGKYHQASQYSDFDKDRSHGLPIHCEAYRLGIFNTGWIEIQTATLADSPCMTR